MKILQIIEAGLWQNSFSTRLSFPSIQVKDQFIFIPLKPVDLEFIGKVFPAEINLRGEVGCVGLPLTILVSEWLWMLLLTLFGKCPSLKSISKNLPLLIFFGCRHQPKRIIQTIRSGVPVATLKVAVLEHLPRPDAAGCPILSAVFFLPGDKLQQAVGDCHVFAPATAQDVAAGAILRDPPLV